MLAFHQILAKLFPYPSVHVLNTMESPAMRRLRHTQILLQRTAKDGERGIALILCLLVLVIVLVIAMQLSYTVAVEERIAQNSSSDQNLGLAARGAFYHLIAQFKLDEAGEIIVGEYELKGADTLAEPWMDPAAKETLKFSTAGDSGDSSAGGDVQISYEVVDLDGRFNLNWLTCENAAFKKHAEDSLKRLIKQLGHEDEEFFEAFKTFITGEGEEDDPNATEPTTPADTTSSTVGETTEVPVPARQLTSLDELWDMEYEGIAEILTGKDENGTEVEGKKPLLDYLTVWNTAGINFNTADPLIIVCWWPNKDKKKNGAKTFNTATRIKAAKEVIVSRLHLEGDENFDVEEDETTDPNATEDTEGTESDPNATDPNDTNDSDNPDEVAASEWIGKGPLKNHTDIAKLATLKFIYSEQSGKGPPRAKAGGAAATEVTVPGAASLKNWYDAVKFDSRLYRVTITTTQGDFPPKIFEAVVFRGRTESESGPVIKSRVLEWRERTE
jgi:hypothetical protein